MGLPILIYRPMAPCHGQRRRVWVWPQGLGLGLGPVSRKYLSLSRTQFHSTRADPYPICDLPELSEIEFYSDLSIFEKLGLGLV